MSYILKFLAASNHAYGLHIYDIYKERTNIKKYIYKSQSKQIKQSMTEKLV